MKEESLLLQYIGDTPKLRIIDFLLDNEGSDYSKDEMMQYGSLKETRKYEKIQLYMLNNDELISRLKSLDDKLTERVMRNALEESIRT